MPKKGNKKIFSKLLPALLLLVLITVPFFANVQAATEEGGEKCGWTNMAGCVEMAWGKLVGSIADLVLSLAAFVTYAAGTLLDFVIKYTIVDMSANVGVITGISTAWSALRDLANIFFIFILLYAAIATVLQLGGNTKKIITRVIIIALLINFSLFFTRVMIDVSNALSVGFYNAIISNVSGSDGISYAYMQKLLLATVYQPGSGAGVDLTKFPEVGFLGAIFFLVAAFVFLAAAVLFISRFVVLIFLMILSAPAFAAMALPSDKYSSKWWDALWSQLIFAPVFFILSWATLQVLNETLGSLGTGASLKDAIAGSIDAKGNKTAIPEAAAIFANFGIAITFMIATLTVAKSLAGTAGKGIQNFVGGVVGGATVGAAAWAGRRLIGGYGARMLRDEGLKDAATKPGAAGFAARLALSGASSATKVSFDARNIKAGGIGGAISKDLGKGGGKGGFAAYEKEEKKKAEEFGKILKPEGQLKEQIDEARKRSETLQKELKDREKEIKSEAEKRLKQLEIEERNISDKTVNEEETRRRINEEPVQETPELREIRSRLKSEEQAQAGFTTGHIKDQKKIQELRKSEEETIAKIRKEKIESAINKGRESISEARNRIQKEREKIDEEIKSAIRTEKTKTGEEIEKLKPLIETQQRRAEGAAKIIEGEWWSQTRGARAGTIRKTLKEKTKEEKALDTLKESLEKDEEKESKKDEEGEKGGEKGKES